ncbi:hypothetical protein [Methanothermobacter tenebrarum]|uniref:Uncharacterized protein n=1 Tax=Methanothermobacter tenebrarum TaxID=680118 RepID=A0A328PD79_9EURY|nr:hypothetical protein [Methanothermobacter tenebrarum]RAO79233.1 hypothetical protein DPC56_04765 [Methanothermobacter tenebrarum]
MRRAIITLILLVFFLSSVSAVNLLVSPTRFEIKNTTHFSGKVTVENFGNETIDVTVDKKRILKDKTHLLLVDGGASDWIKIKETKFTLRPKEHKDVHFEVNVPSNYNYRDSVGALVIRATPKSTPQAKGGGTQFVIMQGAEVIVPIVIGLPGPIKESLKLEKFKVPLIIITPLPGEFRYTLKNTGNTYQNFTGTITLKGWFTNAKINSKGGVYPGDEYTDVVTWRPGLWDLGIYHADAKIEYGIYNPQRPLETTSQVIVIPGWLIVLIILLIVWRFLKGKKMPIKIKIEREQ